jgi:hypothetical protein
MSQKQIASIINAHTNTDWLEGSSHKILSIKYPEQSYQILPQCKPAKTTLRRFENPPKRELNAIGKSGFHTYLN